MTANGSNPAMLPKKYKIVLSGGMGAPHGNIKFNQKPIKLLNASFMDVYHVKKNICPYISKAPGVHT